MADEQLIPNAENGDFDCPKAAASRACACGFCVALRTRITPQAEQPGSAGEAVYQVRRPNDPIYENPPWHEVSKWNYESLADYRGYERRTLYTTPPLAPVGVDALQDICHERALAAGWWNCPVTGEVSTPEYIQQTMVPQKLLLIHSEISEACEAHRKNTMDSHLPHRNGVEVELADALIRIFDLAGALGLNLGAAMAEKMAYNAQRADHKLEARMADGGKRY